MRELPRSELVQHWPITVDGVVHQGWTEIVSDPNPRQGPAWCSCTGDLSLGRSGPWNYFGPFHRHIAALWHKAKQPREVA